MSLPELGLTILSRRDPCTVNRTPEGSSASLSIALSLDTAGPVQPQACVPPQDTEQEPAAAVCALCSLPGQYCSVGCNSRSTQPALMHPCIPDLAYPDRWIVTCLAVRLGCSCQLFCLRCLSRLLHSYMSFSQRCMKRRREPNPCRGLLLWDASQQSLTPEEALAVSVRFSLFPNTPSLRGCCEADFTEK